MGVRANRAEEGSAVREGAVPASAAQAARSCSVMLITARMAALAASKSAGAELLLRFWATLAARASFKIWEGVAVLFKTAFPASSTSLFKALEPCSKHARRSFPTRASWEAATVSAEDCVEVPGSALSVVVAGVGVDVVAGVTADVVVAGVTADVVVAGVTVDVVVTTAAGAVVTAGPLRVGGGERSMSSKCWSEGSKMCRR